MITVPPPVYNSNAVKQVHTSDKDPHKKKKEHEDSLEEVTDEIVIGADEAVTSNSNHKLDADGGLDINV